MTKRNPRQTRFRVELKRLLKRRVPAAKAMKMAWNRVPKNPRKARPTQHPRVCGVHYAHGMVERWCSRRRGHAGPHSGNINPKRRATAKEVMARVPSSAIYRTLVRLGVAPAAAASAVAKDARGNPLTWAKARKILHHGHARGYPLTAGQRGLLGAIASGYPLREYTNPPPIKLLANGRLVGLIGFRPTRGRKIARNPSIDIRV